MTATFGGISQQLTGVTFSPRTIVLPRLTALALWESIAPAALPSEISQLLMLGVQATDIVDAFFRPIEEVLTARSNVTQAQLSFRPTAFDWLELSCRRAGFNSFGQRLEINTARTKFGREMYEVTWTATKSVQSPNDQSVTFTQRFKTSIKFHGQYVVLPPPCRRLCMPQ